MPPMPNAHEKERKHAWKDPSLESERMSDTTHARRRSNEDAATPPHRARSQAEVDEEREKEHEEEDVELEDAEGGAP